jgi:hypothetical protein
MLSISRESWSDEAAEMLRPAVANDPLCVVDDLSGLPLFIGRHNGKPVLAYLLRVDETPHGSEGVIVAAAGSMPGVDLTGRVLPYIESQLDCDWLRIHTARAGLGRKLQQQEYAYRETVWAKKLRGSHGRTEQ